MPASIARSKKSRRHRTAVAAPKGFHAPKDRAAQEEALRERKEGFRQALEDVKSGRVINVDSKSFDDDIDALFK